jgi:hypothetical protein
MNENPGHGPPLVVLPNQWREDGPDDLPVSQGTLLLPFDERSNVGFAKDGKPFRLPKVRIEINFEIRKEKISPGDGIQVVGLSRCTERICSCRPGAEDNLWRPIISVTISKARNRAAKLSSKEKMSGKKQEKQEKREKEKKGKIEKEAGTRFRQAFVHNGPQPHTCHGPSLARRGKASRETGSTRPGSSTGSMNIPKCLRR